MGSSVVGKSLWALRSTDHTFFFQVTALMATLRSHCMGMALAGAGGGGYMYAIKANPKPLSKKLQLDGLTCDSVEVDEVGLEVLVGCQLLSRPADEDKILTEEQWVNLLKEVKVVNK